MSSALKEASVRVQLASLDPINGTSWTISLPPGSKAPQILRGLDYTVIIVGTKEAKATDTSESKAPVALALADLIGLLARRENDK